MPSKVLIVDDDPLIHVLYKHQLERAGYELITAKDGAEVVEVASREQPQMIVMDIIMKEMDGLAALRDLKKNEATKSIPVVISTASVSAHYATKKECENSGAVGFLTKPFSPAQLIAEVKRITGDSGPKDAPGTKAG
jgi:CheY-like chemotaxis protein